MWTIDEHTKMPYAVLGNQQVMTLIYKFENCAVIAIGFKVTEEQEKEFKDCMSGNPLPGSCGGKIIPVITFEAQNLEDLDNFIANFEEAREHLKNIAGKE